jgi:transposase
MFAFSSAQHYYLYREPTDMRKSFNGLSGLVRSELGRDPLKGDVFIFINRRRDKIKLLVWDRSGFIIFYKSLEQGTFELPAFKPGDKSYTLKWEELVLILEGVELKSVRRRKRFTRSDQRTGATLVS